MSTNTTALGIIFPNIYDKLVPELVTDRLMASVPFASRYRMVDFILSSMVNSDITNISILTRQNYHSLLDHLGSGREWDLARKNGGLNIFPPFAQKTIGVYGERIDALQSIIAFLKNQKEKYVVMSDTNIAINIDFKKLISAHVESGADVTIAYTKEELPASVMEATNTSKGLYYTLDIAENGVVEDIKINPQVPGIQNFGLNIYVIDRELLIDKVNAAFMRGGVYLERDIFLPLVAEGKVSAYEYTDYVARIGSLKGYFDANMALLEDENLDKLFTSNPIYTKIRDDNPTRYIGDASATNVLVADGCVIEGKVENSILFRGVKIERGAHVKNCILMQDTVVEAGADLNYIITDKKVKVSAYKDLSGTESFPVFISKGQIV